MVSRAGLNIFEMGKIRGFHRKDYTYNSIILLRLLQANLIWLIYRIKSVNKQNKLLFALLQKIISLFSKKRHKMAPKSSDNSHHLYTVIVQVTGSFYIINL